MVSAWPDSAVTPQRKPGDNAIWEFTYQQGRHTMRAMQMVIPDPATKKIFILDWRGPRTDWARDLTTFDQIAGTFSSLLGE